MKKILLYSVLLMTSITSRGQNLVPNSSFELYSNCPTTYTQFNGYISFWTNPALFPGPGLTGSPDYFNSCATSLVSVPDNVFGYQVPHSGDAYCGIVLWSSAAVHREYIQVPLTSTLKDGCYHFEMYVNLANEYKYLASNIGVYFSSTPITGVPNALPLPVTPQLNLSGFTTDTLSWTLLSGNYTAQGNENYLIIGNFNDDANTNVSFVNFFGVQDHSYIFVDDVSLTQCATTSINEHNENNFTIYPNPVTDHQLQILFSGANNDGGNFEMFDVNGRKVFATNLTQLNSGVIDLPELAEGIYQCVITNENNRIMKKVAVINK